MRKLVGVLVLGVVACAKSVPPTDAGATYSGQSDAGQVAVLTDSAVPLGVQPSPREAGVYKLGSTPFASAIYAKQGGTILVPDPLTAMHLQPTDPAKGPFQIGIIDLSSGGQDDSVLEYGYNAGGVVAGEPQAIFNVEQHFFLGVHQEEMYWQFTDIGGGVSVRPIASQFNRLTGASSLTLSMGATLGVDTVTISDPSGTPIVNVVNGGTMNAMFISNIQTTLQAPSGGAIYLNGVAGTTNEIVTTGGVQIGAATSFGGGIGVLGISDATTAPTSNPAAAAVLWSDATNGFEGRSKAGNVVTLVPVNTGSVNTQLLTVERDTRTCRTTAAGQTCVLSIPVPTDHNGDYDIRVKGRVTVAGGIAVVGDRFVYRSLASAKNVAGTVTSSLIGTPLLLSTDTSQVGDTVVATSPGTSLVITATQIGVTNTGTIDWQISDEDELN